MAYTALLERRRIKNDGEEKNDQQKVGKQLTEKGGLRADEGIWGGGILE